jgi:hypothetical protein
MISHQLYPEIELFFREKLILWIVCTSHIEHRDSTNNPGKKRVYHATVKKSNFKSIFVICV